MKKETQNNIEEKIKMLNNEMFFIKTTINASYGVRIKSMYSYKYYHSLKIKKMRLTKILNLITIK